MIVDMAGLRIGKLRVLSRDGVLNTEAAWHCLCDCGKTTRARGSHLRAGNIRSCGCLQRISSLIHGHAATRRQKPSPTYVSWAGMHARCSNPKTINYKSYGGRGIRVDIRWKLFENFLKDMGERPGGMTLDRIDGTQGYGPDNCRWANSRQQSANRRTSQAAERIA